MRSNAQTRNLDLAKKRTQGRKTLVPIAADISNDNFRRTKELSFSKTSGNPVDNFWADIRTLNKFFSGQFLIFFLRFFLPRDAGHVGYRNCSTFVWPRRTFGKAKQISCKAYAQKQIGCLPTGKRVCACLTGHKARPAAARQTSF